MHDMVPEENGSVLGKDCTEYTSSGQMRRFFLLAKEGQQTQIISIKFILFKQLFG